MGRPRCILYDKIPVRRWDLSSYAITRPSVSSTQIGHSTSNGTRVKGNYNYSLAEICAPNNQHSGE